MRILIVDDNRDLADALVDTLELDDHEVSAAYSAEEALDKLRAEDRYELVFMDVKLPKMSGLDALPKVHEIDPDLRVVIMTGYRIDQLLVEAIGDRAVRILRKPFQVEDVVAAIREVSSAGIVLIADDDPDFVGAMTEVFEEHNYDVLVAKDGRQAVRQVLDNKVDVLVLDLRMPILDGLEVYLELQEKGRAVPTVLVTGYREDNEKQIDVLRSLSVTGCLFKPFSPDKLLDEVARLCERREANK